MFLSTLLIISVCLMKRKNKTCIYDYYYYWFGDSRLVVGHPRGWTIYHLVPFIYLFINIFLFHLESFFIKLPLISSRPSPPFLCVCVCVFGRMRCALIRQQIILFGREANAVNWVIIPLIAFHSLARQLFS